MATIGITTTEQFQSTRPHGARRRTRRGLSRCPRVSIHAPARGATTGIYDRTTYLQSFNPRARTGRDVPTPSGAYQLQVSIHAPARGATLNICSTSLFLYRVSIHAPARGATGADQAHGRAGSVSIHAPARGATIAAASDIFGTKFQSTRPHGARPWTKTDRGSPRGFNPRARTGRDAPQRLEAGVVEVSIHAPARGATPMTYLPSGSIVSFNPRARTGRDLATATSMARVCRFNPRARTGRDRLILSTSVVASLFQSTRPHGARQRHAALD